MEAILAVFQKGLFHFETKVFCFWQSIRPPRNNLAAEAR